MAIIGHGIDLETLEGFELYANDEDWIARVFTLDERADFGTGDNRTQSICGRWCLKEAVLKALGVGFSEGIWLHDIQIGQDAAGQPHVSLKDEAKRRAEALGISGWHVSISHSETAVIASAIAERG